MNHRLVERCVEALCRKGCRAVWQDIQRLESGEVLPETGRLSESERQAVIDELKDVMGVYGSGTCC